MNSFENRNILVTGGTGFVGSHLVKKLLERKANVITTFQTINPLSYFYTLKLQNKATMVYADICDFEKLFDIITKFNIEYIFHLAAQPLVDVAYYNPKKTLESNILGTINICESARLFSRIKAVIIASSDKAYGKLYKDKYREDDSLKGDHPYEVSKSSADLIAYSYFKTYDVPVVITRFGNIYGEGDLNFSRIVPGIMKAVIKGKTLEIRSNGKYIRDYLYVEDVIAGYLLLIENIERIKGEAFNFGSSEAFSVINLIKETGRALGKEIRYKILNIAKNEISYQSLDYSKIKKKLSWIPKSKISEKASSIFNYYEKILQ